MLIYPRRFAQSLTLKPFRKAGRYFAYFSTQLANAQAARGQSSNTSQNINMKVLKEKAQISRGIVQITRSYLTLNEQKLAELGLIQNTNFWKQNNPDSLKTKILSYLTEVKCQSQVKSQMLSYYNEGIAPDQLDKVQERFINGLNPNGNLDFCPNHMVTTQVFDSICNPLTPMKKILLKGHYGISKSFSFIFYKKITENILKYYAEALKIKEKSNDSTHFDEAIKLLDVSKIVYWSVGDLQSPVNKQEILTNILNQCFQIDVKSVKGKAFEKKSIQRLDKLYAQKKIKLTLVIDQVNSLADAIRNHLNAIRFQINEEERLRKASPNASYQDLKSKIESLIQDKFGQTFDLLKEKSDRARQINSIIAELRGQFQSIIFLSPVNIEEKIMRILDLNGQHHHSNTTKKQIQFADKILNSNTKRDLIEFFIFQLNRQCTKQIFSQNLQKQDIIKQLENKENKIQEKVTSYFKEHPNKQFLVTPLMIREKVKEQIGLRKFGSVNQLSEKIPIWIQDMIQQHLLSLKQKLGVFLSNDDIKLHRNKIALKLYYQTKAKLNEFEEQQKQNQSNWLPQIRVNIEYNQKQSLESIDQQMFEYNNINKNFKCLLHPKIFVQIMEFSLASIEQKIQAIFGKDQLHKALGDGFGEFAEKTILQMLCTKDSLLTLTIKDRKDTKSIIYFPIIQPNAYGFLPLTKNCSFFKQLKQNAGNWFFNKPDNNFIMLPVPIKKKEIKERQNVQVRERLPNSRLIDLIMIKKQKWNDIKALKIYAFDLTTKRDKARSKTKQFISVYSSLIRETNISDNTGIRLQMHYFVVVLGHQFDLSENIKDPQNFLLQLKMLSSSKTGSKQSKIDEEQSDKSKNMERQSQTYSKEQIELIQKQKKLDFKYSGNQIEVTSADPNNPDSILKSVGVIQSFNGFYIQNQSNEFKFKIERQKDLIHRNGQNKILKK